MSTTTRRSARLSAAAAANGTPATAPAPAPAKTTARKRKAVSSSDDLPTKAVPNGDAPTTPRKRRQRAVPDTPTPSNAKLISEPAGAAVTTPKPKPAAVRRLADTNRTNAALLSPETSRVVTAVSASAPASPSKAPCAPTAGTTTETLLEEACAHLIAVDPRMRPLIEAHPCRPFSPEGLAERIDPFESLCSGIISQQVSGAAARAIKERFVALFEPAQAQKDDVDIADDQEEADDTTKKKKRRFPQPSEVAACSLDKLRTAGLSQRKAEYLQGLASHFVSGELSARLLADAPYEELLERLTVVRGLGRWSAEMFACFALKRADVFSLGDLGVQRGMAAFVGRDVAKLKKSGGGGSKAAAKWKYMSEAEMTEISDRFRPYRSLFMWYMWRVEETDVSTMEQ